MDADLGESHKITIVEAEANNVGFASIYNRDEDYASLSMLELRKLKEKLVEFFQDYDTRRHINGLA